MAKIPLAGQIAEIKRELAMRANVYPRLVAERKMRQSEADLCISRMEAVLATLMFCQQYEADIRLYIAKKERRRNPRRQGRS
jgi:hypothetical protein